MNHFLIKFARELSEKKIVKDWKDLEPTGNFPSCTTSCLDKALEVKIVKTGSFGERKIDRNDKIVM